MSGSFVMAAQTILTIFFGVIVAGFLIVDLGFFNRQSHRIEFKPALYLSIFWIVISLVFGLLIYIFIGKVMAVEFLSAYITEKMLSVDNLFVILLIFSYFKLEEKYHHRALFWGILGAIVFRGVFIGVGAYIISQFYWVLYIFGAILLYTGIKLLAEKKEEQVLFYLAVYGGSDGRGDRHRFCGGFHSGGICNLPKSFYCVHFQYFRHLGLAGALFSARKHIASFSSLAERSRGYPHFYWPQNALRYFRLAHILLRIFWGHNVRTGFVDSFVLLVPQKDLKIGYNVDDAHPNYFQEGI